MNPAAEVQGSEVPAADSVSVPGVPTRPSRRLRRIALGIGLLLALAFGASGYWANAHPDKAAELSRSLIGDERTAQLEGVVLKLKDEKDQLSYRFFGGRENPFAESSIAVVTEPSDGGLTAEDVPASQHVRRPHADAAHLQSEEIPATPKPAPMVLPATYLIHSQPAPGEGVWVVDGLPRTTLDDVLMAKTYIRPDTERPYASVGVLLLDHRRIRLHLIGGTSDPGKGPGAIPEHDLPGLLVTLNGGFQKDHGSWGLFLDGVTHKPLRNGYATAVVMADGTVKIGEWGEGDLAEQTADMVAVRQNAVLLIEHGEITPAAANEGSNNEVWGYVNVNSAEFITWRSAIGLTTNGDLIVAAGNSVSAGSLAKALHAAGAYVAMQLDINSPHVSVSLVHHQPDGSMSATFFMDTMSGNPGRYLGVHERDFMYITLDESRYER